MRESKFDRALAKNQIDLAMYMVLRFSLWTENYGTYRKIDRDFENGLLIVREGKLVKSEEK
jgi:hypothetical protein